MMMRPMKLLFAVGHRPHAIDRKKYGKPYVALYWARRGDFVHPGLHLWIIRRHWRILPVPKPVLH